MTHFRKMIRGLADPFVRCTDECVALIFILGPMCVLMAAYAVCRRGNL